MERRSHRLLLCVIAVLLLVGLCCLLWPHSFADLQPGCDQITIFRIDTADDGVSQTFTQETYTSGSAGFERVMDILSRYPYHRSFRTLTKANGTEDDHAGFWLHVYLDRGEDRVTFTCGGTGEILIDSLVWLVGYWGDRASLALMAELAAVLAGGQEGAG